MWKKTQISWLPQPCACAKCKLKYHFAIRCLKNIHEVSISDNELSVSADSVMTLLLENKQSEPRKSITPQNELINFINFMNNIKKVSETWMKI